MSSCSATIEYDEPGTYTNLDIIKGKVHIALRNETTVKNIVVKMEGVSKTTVPIVEPEDPHNRRRGRGRESNHDAIEVHKMLYKTVTVFPPPEIERNSTSNEFTLPAGEYTYPFQFKVPLKANCTKSGGRQAGLLNQLVFNAGGLDYARSATGHVDALLPPSLSGFGEMATIKYFCKATVNRASMFKMNTRTTNPFILLPMDVPLIDEGKKAFVRRELRVGIDRPQQQPQTSRSKGKGKLFGGLFGNGGLSNMMGINSYNGKTMTFAFEARYPKTGAFKAVSQLPLQLVLLTSTLPANDEIKSIEMTDLTINLFATTECKAQTYNKVSELKLNLCDKRNINATIPLNQATESQARDAAGKPMYQLVVDPSLLNGVEIPDYVPPTFTACNINRKYTLEIYAGFRANPSLPAEYVSLTIDAVVRSGIPIPQNPESEGSQVPPMSTRPQQQPVPPSADEKVQLQQHHEQQDAKAQQSYQQPGPPTSEGQVAGDESLPSYDEVITCPEYGEASNSGSTSAAPSSSSNAAQQPQQQQPSRRNFAQSEDYYQNLDKYD